MTDQNIGACKQDRAAATNHFGAWTMLGILTVVSAAGALGLWITF